MEDTALHCFVLQNKNKNRNSVAEEGEVEDDDYLLFNCKANYS